MMRYVSEKFTEAIHMKKMATYSICGEWNQPMESVWVENPPVARVESAWLMASQRLMPQR